MIQLLQSNAAGYRDIVHIRVPGSSELARRRLRGKRSLRAAMSFENEPGLTGPDRYPSGRAARAAHPPRSLSVAGFCRSGRETGPFLLV
ncbi:hypothetical protein [Pseudoduganella sp. GCM10020061]|uniref:hypothetical protein n=1 Tax=Pseudoduganella sp. GCM10020061 TaxID=3317345 RepID=UPI003634CA4C